MARRRFRRATGAYSPECVEGTSVLKNSFALSCASGSEAEYVVFVVF
jgi:hypothetical protein